MTASFENRGKESGSVAAHDTGAPEGLFHYLRDGWAERPATIPVPHDHAEAFRERRRKLLAAFPGCALIIPSGHEKVRANDTYYRFRPGSDFAYLTGCHEPDAVLVLLGDRGGESVLLLELPAPRGTRAFFADRRRGEFWMGQRPSREERQVLHAVDRCESLGALDDLLRGVPAERRVVLPGVSASLEAQVRPEGDGRRLAEVLAEARLIKDEREVTEIERAIASTRRGFEDVIRALPTARTERGVEGVFGLRARVEGNDVGYPTVAAAGEHACTVHWEWNDGEIRPGELLLLDAGVEGTSLYTADITRTLPISGRFTAPQREVYDLVLSAQRAAIAAVRPGADFMEANRVAQRVLAEGLVRMGILRTSVDEALAPDQQLQRRYSVHNVSHMLGIDVHDCAHARSQTYAFGPLRAGMVFTVEPGLYLRPDDLTVPERYRGIGVRIEDDVLVTPTGVRVLSEAIPKGADDVEAWMAGLRAG